MTMSPPGASPDRPSTGLHGHLQARLLRARATAREYARRHRVLLWPLVPMLLLCLLSAPLLGAWLRWVELPGIVRDQALQPCGQTTAGTAERGNAASVSLDAQEAALAPVDCAGMRRIDTATGLRTAAYRFEDGSLLTLHLRAPPAPVAQRDTPGPAADGISTAASASAAAGADAGGDVEVDVDADADTGPFAGVGTDPAAIAPAADDARPVAAPPPILTATCPVQSRQSLLVLAGLLLVGVIVIVHRLRAGGKFFDFRTVVSEPLRPGEVLLLIYAFTLIAGTGIGLQFGGCEAAAHRDTVQVERTPTPLKVPTVR